MWMLLASLTDTHASPPALLDPASRGPSRPALIEPEVCDEFVAEPIEHEVEPEPARVEPESEIAEPEPATMEPESVIAEPEPATMEPESVIAEPASPSMEPESVIVEPASPSMEPESVIVEPAPPSMEPESVIAEAQEAEPEPVIATPAPPNARKAPALAAWLDEAAGYRGNGAGTAATFVRADPGNESLEITLYLHPGRSCLGVLGLDRMRAQFDLVGARVFESMGQAELAADELVGFLAEVRGGFIDSAGQRRETGVLYIPTLEP